MSKFPDLARAALLGVMIAATPVDAGEFGLGRAATSDEIAAWNLDVSPDGRGLPAGAGSVLDGEELFADACAACHGDFAEGVGNWPKLAGGQGTLDQERPQKTVGSYWPYLSTVWDYINRSMPYGDAQTLTPDEVYALVAYILYSNDLVDEEFVLTRENLPGVEMPNRDGFIVDDRAQVEYPGLSQAPCMDDCKEPVAITKHVVVRALNP
ncbi:MAG: cytochrome C [Rhodobacteraceae bacterium]|nr:MAG: cytochrome C [Paracoccaceae bacterium]